MKKLRFPLCHALCALSLTTAAFGGAATYDTKAQTITQDTGNSSVLDEYFEPSAELRYTHDFDTDFKGAPGQASVNEASASVPVPPLRAGDFILLPGLYYSFDEININTRGYRGDFDLHTIQVPLQGAWISKDSPWFVYGYFAAGISSDFNVVDRDSLDLTASLDVGYRFSSNFVLALGVYYTNEYGRDVVLPAGGLLWKISDQWSVDVTPLEAALNYKPGEDWRVKLKAITYGGKWTLENNNEHQRIEMVGARAGVDVDRRLFRKAWLSLGAGATLFNSMRVEDSPNHELFDRDMKPGFYVTGALRWEF